MTGPKRYNSMDPRAANSRRGRVSSPLVWREVAEKVKKRVPAVEPESVQPRKCERGSPCAAEIIRYCCCYYYNCYYPNIKKTFVVIVMQETISLHHKVNFNSQPVIILINCRYLAVQL